MLKTQEQSIWDSVQRSLSVKSKEKNLFEVASSVRHFTEGLIMGLRFLIFKPLKTKLLAFVEASTFTGKASGSFCLFVCCCCYFASLQTLKWELEVNNVFWIIVNMKAILNITFMLLNFNSLRFKILYMVYKFKTYKTNHQ